MLRPDLSITHIMGIVNGDFRRCYVGGQCGARFMSYTYEDIGFTALNSDQLPPNVAALNRYNNYMVGGDDYWNRIMCGNNSQINYPKMAQGLQLRKNGYFDKEYYDNYYYSTPSSTFISYLCKAKKRVRGSRYRIFTDEINSSGLCAPVRDYYPDENNNSHFNNYNVKDIMKVTDNYVVLAEAQVWSEDDRKYYDYIKIYDKESLTENRQIRIETEYSSNVLLGLNNYIYEFIDNEKTYLLVFLSNKCYLICVTDDYKYANLSNNTFLQLTYDDQYNKKPALYFDKNKNYLIFLKITAPQNFDNTQNTLVLIYDFNNIDIDTIEQDIMLTKRFFSICTEDLNATNYLRNKIESQYGETNSFSSISTVTLSSWFIDTDNKLKIYFMDGYRHIYPTNKEQVDDIYCIDCIEIDINNIDKLYKIYEDADYTRRNENIPKYEEYIKFKPFTNTFTINDPDFAENIFKGFNSDLWYANGYSMIDKINRKLYLYFSGKEYTYCTTGLSINFDTEEIYLFDMDNWEEKHEDEEFQTMESLRDCIYNTRAYGSYTDSYILDYDNETKAVTVTMDKFGNLKDPQLFVDFLNYIRNCVDRMYWYISKHSFSCDDNYIYYIAQDNNERRIQLIRRPYKNILTIETDSPVNGSDYNENIAGECLYTSMRPRSTTNGNLILDKVRFDNLD